MKEFIIVFVVAMSLTSFWNGLNLGGEQSAVGSDQPSSTQSNVTNDVVPPPPQSLSNSQPSGGS